MKDCLKKALKRRADGSKRSLVKIGIAPTARYFESCKAVKWKLEKFNSDGLLKLSGEMNGLSSYRLFYKLNDAQDNNTKIKEQKKDILAEFSAKLNEDLCA